MTKGQMKIFIKAAQLGIACGLNHPFEWFYNALDACYHDNWLEMPKNEQKVVDAFLAFYRGTGSHPGDPVEKWTEKDLIEAAKKFYERGEQP